MQQHSVGLGLAAEVDLITQVVEAETADVRTGGGVLICGGGGGLTEWAAADLASASGGAFVSAFWLADRGSVERAKAAGLGVVLYTPMSPAEVLALMECGGMAGAGWAPNAACLLALVERYAHIWLTPEDSQRHVTLGRLADVDPQR